MGECAYYIKAAFKTEVEAKEAFKRLNAFLKESVKAYSFWQDGRSKKGPTFWKAFETNFPLISGYIKKYVTENGKTVWGGDPNDLSGSMDFGEEDPVAGMSGNIVGYGDSNVWHMADWQPFANYITGELGAVKVVWDTEENGCGSIDCLSLYDWEEIVKDVLKQRQLLPCLLGVNKDLDELISSKLKK